MVNNPTQRDVPLFYSPLTHDQHAQLGRIAVLWGQIDMIVDNLLTDVVAIEPELRQHLFADKPIGAKLDALKVFVRRMPDGIEKSEVKLFVDLVDSAKAERNQCFHGVWGFRVTNRQTVEAAAQHHRQPENPFRATALPSLERKLCQISHQGMIALTALGLMEAQLGAYPLFLGDGDRGEWFSKWREQHFANNHIQDHRSKPGRLPFLKNPLGL
jgi:hypothetical protein